MPSTTDALRTLMNKWFEHNEAEYGIDGAVLFFLFSHGFTEKAGYISPPVPAHNVSNIEHLCLRYLVEEWDYGFSGRVDIECD